MNEKKIKVWQSIVYDVCTCMYMYSTTKFVKHNNIIMILRPSSACISQLHKLLPLVKITNTIHNVIFLPLNLPLMVGCDSYAWYTYVMALSWGSDLYDPSSSLQFNLLVL